MKRFNFLAVNTVALSLLTVFLSCGSGSDKKTTDATEDTTMSKTDTTNTMVTEPKPETFMIVQHKVANYSKWKPDYEAHDSVRRSNGLSSYAIGRGMDDPNSLIVYLKAEDLSKARAMANSPDLKTVMQKAGVIGAPTITYLDVVMNDTSSIDEKKRLLVTHRIKNWDDWKKVFDEHKSARIENGLIDRGLGYSDGDKQNVFIVFAVKDLKKAKEFLKSQDLKDKMAAGGVESPPTSFFYNIVETY